MHAPLEAMNGRARRPAAARGAAPRNEKAMEKEQRRPPSSKTAPVSMKASPANATPQCMKNRKIALQQDVDKLRMKLRHEENVHRALERAFTRPLGALPRLPPFLPSQTLELLAEVAVLEEEVVRLEEQVVNFRQGLYRETVITTSMAAKSVYFPDGYRSTPARHKPPAQPQSPELSTSTRQGSDQDAADWLPSLRRATNAMWTPRRPGRSLSQGDSPGKENQSFGSGTNSCREFGLAPLSKVPGCRVVQVAETRAGFQTTSAVEDHKAVEGSNGTGPSKASTAANEVSEELLACLLAIFSQKSASSGQDEERVSLPPVSGSCGSSSADPYCVPEFGWRDIGRYKQFRSVDMNTCAGDDSALGQRLKALLRKLSLVDLAGLSHQHNRLAFWINTYYSCMMNAFLEQGAPSDPRMLVAMMPKLARPSFLFPAGDHQRRRARAERRGDRALHSPAAPLRR
ncbi:hypothetical protein ZEAMMB73_Zm00001d031807 [Zea mays]|uniref:Ternary complex factor MIP1 leucine-zipper domain-containing protein n=1 Tax=Zea mays TaxID=4577 RepID=A0A1D6KLC2_MAIZE|nr:hypothetical protein ZEAMMB73_Zm00001d031807 [Zea mays]